jgi:hypothetical protein
LWSIQVQTDAEQPWIDLGAHNAEWKDVLRTYDYRKEHFPEEGVRIVNTEVVVRVADPDWLRLRKKADEDEATAVQSD